MNVENIKKPSLVSFDNQPIKDDMVNATAMAKPFGKKPSDWLRMQSAKCFLSALAEVKNMPVEDLVRRIKNKNEQGREKGILIHHDVALEFARWLSPSFAIWNNQHTRQILLTGKTETINSLAVLASGLLLTLQSSDDIINEQTRKAHYHDAVLQSRTLIPVSVIAKEMGMSAKALNRWLSGKEIIYKSDNHWLLYAGYQGKGYTGTKTALYIDSKGNYQSNIHTYWTEKGREFIHSLFRDTGRQIA